MFIYQIYGLIVESEIEIEEALAVNNKKADVVIVREKISPHVFNDVSADERKRYHVVYTKNSMAFVIPKVADYLVEKGKITIDIKDENKLLLVKTFLLGSAIGFQCYLNNIILIHGSSVARNGKGMIVTGECGSGKSTVLCKLMQSGYDFISDDVCRINQRNNRPWVELGYPQMKLCRDAAIQMHYDLDKLIYIDENRDKFAVRLKDGFLPEGQCVKYVFELAVSDCDELKIIKVTGHEKLQLILRNIFRGENSMSMWGVNPHYMKKLVSMLPDIAVYRIERPSSSDTVNDIIEAIDGIQGLNEK